MKKNTQGFTLIEILMVILISSMLSITLWQMFKQISRGVDYLSKVIEMDEPIMPFYNQLDLDISGMFVAQTTAQAFLKKFAVKKEQEKEQVKPGENKSQTLENTNSQKESDETQENYIKNNFYINTKEDRLVLSFITTSGIRPIEVKDGKPSLKPEPLIKRVAYILEKDPNNQDVKRMIYRSSTNLDLDSIEKIDFSPSNIIFRNVRNFSVELVLFEHKELKPGQNPKEKSTKKTATLKEWSEEEVFKKYKALIPAFITVRGSYTDTTGKLDYPFEFKFKVYGYTEIKEEKNKKANEEGTAFNKIVSFVGEKFPGAKNEKNNHNEKIEIKNKAI